MDKDVALLDIVFVQWCVTLYATQLFCPLFVGDPFWFIERCVTLATENGIYFSLVLFAFACVLIDISCETYMLTYKPSIDTILRFGPMYANFLFCLFCIFPHLKQRYQYQKLIRSIRKEFCSLVNIDAKSYEEIRGLYRNVVIITIFLLGTSLSGVSLLLPWSGIDYETTIWPEVQFLSIMNNPPKWLSTVLLFINYASAYPKALLMCLYGEHLMHLCLLYKVQHSLLKRRFKKIRYPGKLDDLYLNDLTSYQRRVQMELVACIKLHIRLKKFGTSMTDYFNLPVLIHSFTGVLLFTMVGYIILFGKSQHNSIGFNMELVAAISMVCIYAHCGEIFSAQIGELRNIFYEIPWNTFDTKNRKIMLIYGNILKETQRIGLLSFSLNYMLALWILHKVVNFLTILGQLSPNE